MKQLRLLVAGCILGSAAFGQGASKPEAFEAQDDGPPAIVQWAQGHKPEFAGKGGGAATKSSPLLTSHGGMVLTSTNVATIFWGKSWNGSDASFKATEKMDGIAAFYNNVGNSAYVRSNIEYTGPGGTVVGPGVTLRGSVTDSATAAPSGAPVTSGILAKVCSVISSGQLSAIANGYYAVYVDTKRGNTGYCAWHTNGKCGQTPIEFGFFFNLDGDNACDPHADLSVHGQGVSALVNVSGHELSETMTDPQLNGWYDRQGEENADKCAWTFSTGNGVNNVSFGGTTWKIQGNWSNNAYNANGGYTDPVKGFQKGCLDNVATP